MGKCKETILLLALTLLLKCHAEDYPMPKGYNWTTCSGNLYLKAGQPSRYLTMRKDRDWQEHSWLVHNKPKPSDVEILPLSDELKKLIVQEVNTRRAKTLLGAYFDPKRAGEFGFVPPAGELRTIEYSDDIARAAERYMQHVEYEHYYHNGFYPYACLGENLAEYYIAESRLDNGAVDRKKVLLKAFKNWFDKEMPYYKHYEPYRHRPLMSQVNDLFVGPIKNDRTLTKKEKKKKLRHVQFGHFTALIVKELTAVGCAIAQKIETVERPEDDEWKWYIVYIACNFGRGCVTDDHPLYDMDENILEQHGISKDTFDQEEE